MTRTAQEAVPASASQPRQPAGCCAPAETAMLVKMSPSTSEFAAVEVAGRRTRSASTAPAPASSPADMSHARLCRDLRGIHVAGEQFDVAGPSALISELRRLESELISVWRQYLRAPFHSA